jgi:hypothetical protein
VRRIQTRHQGKRADREEERRGKRAQKTQAGPGADEQVGGDNRPRNEKSGFIQIVDRAPLQRKAALKHRRRMKSKGPQKQAIIDPVVLPKTSAQKKNRVNRAGAIKNDGQQKIPSVRKPGHDASVIKPPNRASGKSGSGPI